ncbi:MAG: CPBP family intramembrane glutamic endopeptidase [Planctomycetota bacterium]|jgi:membrane protease YdiL (CAAX protease family)
MTNAVSRHLPIDCPLPSGVRPWQRRPTTQILAAAAAAAPMAAISIWMYLVRDSAVTLNEMLLGPLIGGGSLILWILFLHFLVCSDGPAGLGFRVGRSWRDLGLDVGLGVGLSVGLLAFHFGFGATVARLLPARPPVEEMIELLTGLVQNPWLLAIWLGPVVWIGVALFEELMRVFVLRRLWRVWSEPLGKWVVICGVSALIGLAHGYQGSAAILSIGIMSVFKGWFFMKTGRIGALIVAHALYDSVQIVMAVIAIRGMGA